MKLVGGRWGGQKMIQQNDVLHWQCSEDAPFMLQLLFNHLHLEHLSSVSLYGT